MSDSEFDELGKNLLLWKMQYYHLSNPSVSDEHYDYQEWLYCEEATKRGIEKNDVGQMIDGKFFTIVGFKYED